MRLIRLTLVVIMALALWPWGRPHPPRAAAADAATLVEAEQAQPIISPIWSGAIRRWSHLIQATSRMYGIDPDLIAAVMNAESNGLDDVVSRAGAVGLMGVMPSSPGLEWRPSSDELIDPELNMRWGGAILSEIIQQSGGDINAALAAYSGGWDQANRRVPQEYAARVLDEYGRAVAVRSGVKADIASQWTVAVEIRRGHTPAQPLLFGRQPVSGLVMYGEHLVYHATDKQGHGLYVRGYAVPVALVVPLEPAVTGFGGSNVVDDDLMARLNLVEVKRNESNPRVLLACLPSLSRLRGRVSTRWYAPSNCPAWHRRGPG